MLASFLAIIGQSAALVNGKDFLSGNTNVAAETPRSVKNTEFDEFDNEFLEVEDEDDLDMLFNFLRPDNNDRQRNRRNQESTSTRVNIFQKLGESLGTTIVGCFLIALMPCLIWKNEGRHVDELSRIEFCKNNAVAIDW